jgi:DNA-binding NtrC family response regulator
MSPATPIVFVVDDDVAVRESLEAPMPYAGGRVETFASAQQFLACPQARGPSCLVLDVSRREREVMRRSHKASGTRTPHAAHHCARVAPTCDRAKLCHSNDADYGFPK